jgi:hypothetical protein
MREFFLSSAEKAGGLWAFLHFPSQSRCDNQNRPISQHPLLSGALKWGSDSFVVTFAYGISETTSPGQSLIPPNSTILVYPRATSFSEACLLRFPLRQYTRIS